MRIKRVVPLRARPVCLSCPSAPFTSRGTVLVHFARITARRALPHDFSYLFGAGLFNVRVARHALLRDLFSPSQAQLLSNSVLFRARSLFLLCREAR